jgi:hypothetical protein
METADKADVQKQADPRVAARAEKAEKYFEHDLQGQRSWYSANASRAKGRLQAVSMAVLISGAATSFLQVLRGAPWLPYLTAAIGAFVTIAEGWRQVARYDESWAAYRVASERMKRESRLYTNGASEYSGLSEDKAFITFVERIEAIIAEEQRIFWSKRESNEPASKASSPAPQPAEAQDERR